MHFAMPGGVEWEYTSAEAPPILEVAEGYNKKKAKVLTIRQMGECWKRPFIVAYEPSTNEKPTTQSIENITDGDKVVGAKVVSKVGDRLITDRIIAQEGAEATYANEDEKIQFTGRFAIARTIDSPARRELQLYIGDGEKLSFQGHELAAGDSNSGYKSAANQQAGSTQFAGPSLRRKHVQQDHQNQFSGNQ